MRVKIRAVVAVLSAALLLPATAEAAKKKETVSPSAADGTAASAPSAATPWETYESGVTLVTAGQLEEGAARLEQASEDLSDPIVWCYSRMYLADAHFQLGRAAADSTARERHYESARAWFRQASYCAGAELPADGESARPTPEQVEVIANFQTFGTEDLASQLERVSSAQSELLSSTQDHQAVADHWRLVTQMSGATREAEYRIALACFEDGDFDCAATEAVAGSLLTDSTEPAEPARAIAERAIERAAEVGPPEADTYWRFVFRLVADWHRQEPLDDGPDTVLENALGALDPAERLRLLELSEDCWVPLRVAEGLRDRQAEFVDEAKVAYACDPAGPAKNLLVGHYYNLAKVAWNGLTPLTAEAFNDPDRVRGHLEQIEPALANLEKVLAITDYQRAADLRAKIDQYVSQMDAQRTTLVQQATADTMTYCKQQWNSFRWWSDRRFEMLSKTPSRADFDEYRVGCRQYIESERIGDKVAELEDEIDQALVLRGCQRTWEQLRQQPDPAALREFETSCQEYVKLYEVTEQLQQVKNRIGG